MLNFKRILALALVLCAMVTLLPRTVNAENERMAVTMVPSVEESLTAPQRNASVVRYSGHYDAIIIGCLEDGTKLTILGTYGDFYRISCYEMTGYIAKHQVRQGVDDEYYVNSQPGSSETKTFSSYSAEDALLLKNEVRTFSMQFQGVPYVSGGTTPWGFDCCGFTQYVFNNLGFNIHRTVAAQLEDGLVIGKDDLQCGDLVFFQNTTGWGHFASHVGIYIGNDQIIHAGDSGVAVSDMNHAYYQYHFMCARRVILSDLPADTEISAVGINQNMNSSYWRESSQTVSGLGNSFDVLLAYM